MLFLLKALTLKQGVRRRLFPLLFCTESELDLILRSVEFQPNDVY
jgi:hypothetical protein